MDGWTDATPVCAKLLWCSCSCSHRVRTLPLPHFIRVCELTNKSSEWLQTDTIVQSATCNNPLVYSQLALTIIYENISQRECFIYFRTLNTIKLRTSKFPLNRKHKLGVESSTSVIVKYFNVVPTDAGYYCLDIRFNGKLPHKNLQFWLLPKRNLRRSYILYHLFSKELERTVSGWNKLSEDVRFQSMIQTI